MAVPLACFLVAVLLLLTPSSAAILFSSLRSDDRLIVPFDYFGFTTTGRLDLNVSSFSLSNPNADLSQLGFFLITHRAWLHVVDQLQSSEIDCPLHSDLLHHAFPITGASSFSLHSNVSEGRYHVAFANCLPGVRVTMDVRSELYNLNNGRREYLRAGATEIPLVFRFFSLIYLAIAFIWIFLLYFKRRIPTETHILVFAFIVCKILDLLYNAERRTLLNNTGLLHLLPQLGPNFFASVIVKVHLTILPFLSLVNLFHLDMDLNGQKLLIPFDLLTIICYGLIFYAILLVMKLWIKSQQEAASKNAEVAKKIEKVESLQAYLSVLFSYSLLTTLVIYSIEVATDHSYMWISVAAGELITLGFYLVFLYVDRDRRIFF